MTRFIGGISGPLIILISATVLAGGSFASDGAQRTDGSAAASAFLADLQKDAEQGSVKAQYVLGCCYNGDHGFPKDPVKAVEWWGVAAANGHADAQFCLGLSCFMGDGTPRDAAKAVKWWMMAANQDHRDAQYFLGLSYRTGLGVPQSTALAVFWLQKSAAHGSKAAKEQLRELGAPQG
jgi:TPR repeat protein